MAARPHPGGQSRHGVVGRRPGGRPPPDPRHQTRATRPAPSPLTLTLTLILTLALTRTLTRWDYGYQISGVANRTTLADGNTWNHEHIALLGPRRASNAPAQP